MRAWRLSRRHSLCLVVGWLTTGPPCSPVEPGAGVGLVDAADGREEPLAARGQVGEDELEAGVARLRQDVQRLRHSAQLRVDLRQGAGRGRGRGRPGASLRIFEWGTNRRQCGQPTPKYPKNRKNTGFGFGTLDTRILQKL